jgi:alpha-1,2-mannosyltransferase
MVVLGALPLALAAYFVFVVIPFTSLGLDFRESFWPAANAVLHGGSPYPALDPHVLAQREVFVYPPLVSILLAPFGLLPVGVAAVIAVALVLAALGGCLWVLGVRDWRCYGASLASPAVLASIQTAALSALLALGIALAWKWRASGWAAPALIAAVIAAKLFLWPLLLWLALIRGMRCGVATASGIVALVAGPWVLGFPGAREYPRLLSLLTEIEGRHAYTPRALALSLGTSIRVAEAAAIIAGGAVLTAAVAVRRRERADRDMLALALLAALLLSPIVWAHYLVILLPPLALAYRRMNAAWLAPWGLWLAGGTWTEPTTVQIAASLAVMTLITALALRRPGGARRSALPELAGSTA